MPYLASLPLAALRFLLPYFRLWAVVTIFRYSLPININAPPYLALLVNFAIFPSLPDLEQAPTERSSAMVHDGLMASPTPSLSFLFSLWLSLQLCVSSYLAVASLLPLSYSQRRSSIAIIGVFCHVHSGILIKRPYGAVSSGRKRASTSHPRILKTLMFPLGTEAFNITTLPLADRRRLCFTLLLNPRAYGSHAVSMQYEV